MPDTRTRWSDDRLDDAFYPLRRLPEATTRLEAETKNLREALEVNSDLQKERNRILIGFLGTTVLGLFGAVITLVVAL